MHKETPDGQAMTEEYGRRSALYDTEIAGGQEAYYHGFPSGKDKFESSDGQRLADASVSII